MLQFYNTLKREKQAFKPLQDKQVKMYVCGPTVYGPGHLGHARTYIAFDFIRRYLEYRGFKVKFVVNLTDVHDDMIKEANRQGITIFELADKNIKLFFKDMAALGVKKADAYPRVTEHIQEIIDMVKTLEDKGFAYETEDGVYFEVRKFKGYGKLSNINLDEAKTGTRVETDKYDKASPMDFALWKKQKQANEPAWDSPWGKGRPGWHIECSVMGCKHLGEQLDIHGGAVDLIFPHHENEIAQSEAATGKNPFVRYWLHTGFLNVEGQKMSKSLGNFIEIPDLLKEYEAKDFRFFVSQTHYRSRIDFSKKEMATVKKTLDRLNDFIQRLQEVESNESNPAVGKLIEQARQKVVEALDNDFQTPNMWAAVFSLERESNRLLAENKLGRADAQAVLAFLKEIDAFLGVFTFEQQAVKLTAEQKKLVEEREKLRREKKWAEADKIRDRLLEQGLQLLDTPEGAKVKRV